MKAPSAFRVLAALLAGLVAAAAPAAEPELTPAEALRRGNRLFRNGQIEEAVKTYRAGYSPASPHPTLAYNLGTALHHLDRLPEAILWYRRAADSEDPWLEENLWLARRTLGSQRIEAPGVVGTLVRRGDALRAAAILLAWGAVILLAAAPRLPWPVFALFGTLALALYGGAGALERWGPRPAVLIADCHSDAADLPAGTEAWVWPGEADGWRIAAGADVACPGEAVGLVFP